MPGVTDASHRPSPDDPASGSSVAAAAPAEGPATESTNRPATQGPANKPTDPADKPADPADKPADDADKPAATTPARPTAAQRAARRAALFAQRPGALGVIALGIFLAGYAAGWATTSATPRYAPEVQIVITEPDESDEDVLVMPDVRGLTEPEARQVFVDANLTGLEIAVEERPSIGVPGTVVAQDPPAGSPPGRTITLTLAAPAVIPEIIGAPVTQATSELQSLGATVEVRRVYQPGATVDTVLGVSPAVGEPVTDRVVLEAAGPPASLYLAELRPTGSACSTGEYRVNGTAYPNSIRCRASTSVSEAVYLLDRRTVSLEVVLGQDDTGQPGQRVRFEILADGRSVATHVLDYGQSLPVSVATANVLRLELRVSREGTSGSGTAYGVFAGARVLGGADDIAALRGGGTS